METALNLARYEGLPDINKVNQFSFIEDFECFREIGKVLHKFNKLNKYLITLLHTHFHIDKNELLLDVSELNSEVTLKQVFSINDVNMNKLSPSSWRLSGFNVDKEEEMTNDSLIQEYILNDLLPENISNGNNDNDCFKEVSIVLSKYGNLNRFGLCLNLDSKHKKDKVLMENTDVKQRIQSLEFINEADIDLKNSVQTSWKLNEHIVYLTSGCSTEYESYCNRYCPTRSYCDAPPGTGEWYHGSESDHTGAVHSESKSSYHRRK